ncbi:putative toxin-antitoxin system toxin component, PIN family [Mucilaginibacter sp. X4EP1]
MTTCRDPKDNKFLELAFAAEASCIVSGDQDLLILNPV